MSKYLMVPVQLDVLYVPGEELSVVRQSAHFRRQPYVERTFKKEINSDTANISESIVTQPFQNRTQRLCHGVHLHWALPDALTRGDSGLNFPAVPNRWLVTRKRKSGDRWICDKQWVVESDYLYAPHINRSGVAVSVPYTSEHWRYNEQNEQYQYQPKGYQYNKKDFPPSIQQQTDLLAQLFTVDDSDIVTLKVAEKNLTEHLKNLENSGEVSRHERLQFIRLLRKPLLRSGQPYRYMGRKMPLAAFKADFDGAEYYPSLSAVGSGDPGFAAFYPNCFSVFGFHDEQPGGDLSAVRYEVAGWYSDIDKDVLATFVSTLNNNVADEANAAIKAQFNWQLNSSQTPERLLCYAGVGFDADFNPDYESEDDSTLSVTVANTPTEALSACLADKLVKAQPSLTPSQQQTFLTSLEDQFEAMQLAFRLAENKLDAVARFKEMRHENGFMPVNSGRQWVIRRHRHSDGARPESSHNHGTSLDLPLEIGAALDTVNRLQQTYDGACREIVTMREQLFADWYKYMICVYPNNSDSCDYPDADLVKHFIEQKDILPLQQKMHATGQLLPPVIDAQGHMGNIEVSDDTSAKALAAVLSEHINQLMAQIDRAQTWLNDRQVGKTDHYLEQIPAPSYWQPNNPVVLIEGDAAKPTERHGMDGLLDCQLLVMGEDGSEDGSVAGPFVGVNDFSQLDGAVTEVLAAKTQYNNQLKQPWNPFMLEWKVQLFVTERQSNLNQGYQSDFIHSNYQTTVSQPDLTLKPGKGQLVPSGSSYSGNSLLTSQANTLLKKAIEEQLVDKLRCFDTPEQISSTTYQGDKHFNNPLYSMICGYEKLNTMAVQAQALNGFNQALLMRKQTLSLFIDDPLGFDEYKPFTSDGVLTSMGDNTRNAPSPLNSFNPIRSGCLKLVKLRLVDTFGQIKRIDVGQVDTTYKMTTVASRYLINLPPRLAQPAKLDVNWLNGANASANDQMSNAHPGTGPVCGWLLNNVFDNSLMVYDHEGLALGYFKAGQFKAAIGSHQAADIAAINNPHLRRVVGWINTSLIADAEFLTDFIGTTEDALGNIVLEKNTDPDGTALLVGRPMAVVRASLNLSLYGQPAVNQGWNVFRGDIGRHQRSSDKFTSVQFPLRLGEYGQLNDGLVGYWLESPDDNGQPTFAEPSPFYAPQSDYMTTRPSAKASNRLAATTVNCYQSLQDPAQTVTLLMDVQGSFHASVGILPSKVVKIDEAHFSRALQDIQVSFLHAPILTPQGQTRLSLRDMPGFSWAWLEKQRDENGVTSWSERLAVKWIEKTVFIEQLERQLQHQQQPSGVALWDYLLLETVNWLAVVADNPGSATVVSKDDRVSPFTAPFTGLENLVEGILTLYAVGIDPPVGEGMFSGPQEIKEGWLTLRKSD